MSVDATRREVLEGAAIAAAMLTRSIAHAEDGGGWVKLPTEPSKAKQDDIFFVTPDIGWYGNGKGRVYGTNDGGLHWALLWEKPGTFVRALGFVDEKIGILGNIGLDAFPDVTDPSPLYRTVDGGRTWTAVSEIRGATPKGICAIDVLRHEFVNDGVLDRRVTIHAGGRVGGPAHLLTSKNLGASWISRDLSPLTAAILDIKFVNERVGFIAGSSDPDIERGNAVVLRTKDGGQSWHRVYQSARPYEMTWKLSFPSPRTGFATIQNYDPDSAVKSRVVARTRDGGNSWVELPLAVGHDIQEFGVGFVTVSRGWVGATPSGFETHDGGSSWQSTDIGRATNKIRVIHEGTEHRVFAIGTDVRRLDIRS